MSQQMQLKSIKISMLQDTQPTHNTPS